MRNLQGTAKLRLNISKWISHTPDLKEVLKSPEIASPSPVLETSLPRHANRHARLSSPPPPSSPSWSYDQDFERQSTWSVSEALSRMFATPSVFGPSWHSCSYNSWQLLLNRDYSNPIEMPQGFQLHGLAISPVDVFPLKPGQNSGKWLKRVGRNPEVANHIESEMHNRLLFHNTTIVIPLDLPGYSVKVQGLRTSMRNGCNSIGSLSSTAAVVAGGNSRPESTSKAPFLRLRLHSGACCLPHPEKESRGGEDAFFIASPEQVVGVADGVGGWADVGVDAGQYARELMAQSVLAIGDEPNGCIEPARILERAHSRTKCKGSSTACILALSKDGLHAANLGDSGFIVLRNGQTVFKSPPQQHLFNIPYQLEHDGSDPPTAAEVFCIPVADGDVVVSGTDGLFDNLYDNELISTVVQCTRACLDPETTARKLADLARLRSQDRNRQTPFSSAAQDAGYRFYGGKMDDITVIVSYIRDSGLNIME